MTVIGPASKKPSREKTAIIAVSPTENDEARLFLTKRGLDAVEEYKKGTGEITVAGKITLLSQINNSLARSEGVKLSKKTFQSEGGGWVFYWMMIGGANMLNILWGLPIVTAYSTFFALNFFGIGTGKLIGVLLKLRKNKKLIQTDTIIRIEIALAKKIDRFNTSLKKARVLLMCEDSELAFEEDGKQELFEAVANQHELLESQIKKFESLIELREKIKQVEATSTAIIPTETDAIIDGALIAKKIEIEEELTNLLTELE